jgi:pantetheine-phosphate adenylyltransferase
MKSCVFAGSFDPFTIGHEYVVEKCLELFDKVVIAVGKNADKNPLLSENERLELIKVIYADSPKIQVETFDGMLVDFMKEQGIAYTVRGIRNADDYKYETTMAQYNRDMCPEITTLYIPTPSNIEHISSSGVRTIVKTKGDCLAYIPKAGRKYFEQTLKTN